jgi:hypothetical protein
MTKNGIINTLVGPPRDDTERDARTTGSALTWALAIGLLFAILWQPRFWASSCMWAGACALSGMLLGFLFGIPRFIARTGVPTTSSSLARVQPSDQNPANRPQAPAGDQQSPPAAGDQQSPPAGDQQSPPAGDQQSPPASDQQPPQPPVEQPSASDQVSAQTGVNTNLEEISDWLTKIIVGVSLVELQKAQVKLQGTAEFIAESLGGHAQTSFAYGLMVYFSIAGFLGSYLLTRLYLQRAFREAAS